MNDTDDDFLAPVSALSTDAEPEDTEEDGDDGGIGDGEGIVRIWVEDARLVRVRVSPIWHMKLGRRTLSDCFAQALALADIRIAEPPAGKPSSFDDVDFSHMPRFSSRAFAAFQEAFDEVEQRWDDVLQRDAEQRPQQKPVVSGTHKGVTVFLTEHGVAERVVFDPRWLDNAQAGAICTHVMRAAENAYARFTPAEEDRGELEDIEAEHQFLLTAFKAMLNPKERS